MCATPNHRLGMPTIALFVERNWSGDESCKMCVEYPGGFAGSHPGDHRRNTVFDRKLVE